MSSPAPVGVAPILFQKNLKFMSGNGATGIEITGAADPDVLAAIAADKPFPQRQINLAKISLQANLGKNVELKGNTGTVSFQGKGSAFAGLGVYTTPANLLQDIGLDDDLAPGMSDVSQIADSTFLLLRWGYDVQGSAKGAVALGATGTLTFGLDGEKEGVYAVVRRFPNNTPPGARTAIADTIGSWMLPSQVSAIDDLDPGTWLVAEVDGKLALQLAAQYGYNFSWVRAIQTGALSGDIGLRVQLGASIALGFDLEGKYGIVIGRDSLAAADKKIRLRVFKLNKKGWNFAFNLGASVEAITPQMPAQFDDFLAAVLGVHGSQIMKDLQAVETWTDPNNPPAPMFAGLGVDYAKKFLNSVTGIDVELQLQNAINTFKNALDTWNNLGQETSSLILKYVGNDAALKTIANVAQQVVQLDQASFAKLLQNLLGEAGIGDSPAAQWLESAISGSILTAVTDSQAFAELKKVAQFTTAVLDGSTVQGIITKLQQQLVQRLGLTQILNAVNQGQLDNVDAWLKAKLTQFLGKTLDFNGLKKVQQALHTLISMKDKFYQKALEALQHKYSASMAYAYQSNTTKTALVDVTFDFALNPAVGALLQRAARDGDMNELLLKTIPGVSLNLATLTHEVKRQSHLEITLPYYTTAIDHINDSLAKFSALDAADGRLVLYDLNATDGISVLNRRNSALTIGLHLKNPANDVTHHSSVSASYSYSLRQAIPNMRRAQLQYQTEPYLQQYWPGSFSVSSASPGNGQTSGSIDAWIGDLDKLLDQGLQNGTDNFGNSLLSLDLSLPDDAVAAWLSAPTDQKAFEYMQMSRHLQTCLKHLIPFYYFADPKNYSNVGPGQNGTFALLVYSCIPPSTDIQLDGSQLTLNTNKDVYWDWMDPNKRRAMTWCQDTMARLGAETSRVVNRLRATPGLEKLAAFYAPDQIRTILSSAESSQLESLLHTEAQLIHGACDAAIVLAQAASASDKNPAAALAKLESFGAKVTATFNGNLSSIYGSEALHALGTMLFLEAARALNPALAARTPAALFTLTVVKPDVKPFPPPAYLNAGTAPQEADIVVRQLIANLATA